MTKPQPKQKRTDRKPTQRPKPNPQPSRQPSKSYEIIINTINKRKENENTPIINIINLPNK